MDDRVGVEVVGDILEEIGYRPRRRSRPAGTCLIEKFGVKRTASDVCVEPNHSSGDISQIESLGQIDGLGGRSCGNREVGKRNGDVNRHQLAGFESLNTADSASEVATILLPHDDSRLWYLGRCGRDSTRRIRRNNSTSNTTYA